MDAGISETDVIAGRYDHEFAEVAEVFRIQIADRGQLDYDERVATYWPEFAQNGKADTTVRQVLSHSRGLLRGADGVRHWHR